MAAGESLHAPDAIKSARGNAMIETKPAISVFYSYSHKDRQILANLRAEMAELSELSTVNEWFDRNIQLGSDWHTSIMQSLEASDVVILLLSAHFFSSQYCTRLEMPLALQRARRNECLVVPVIARPCVWESTTLQGLDVLPDGGKPITQWQCRKAALRSVAAGLKGIIRSILSTPKN